ncbi:MAG TPA: zinc-binding alcohol dehydrogenase [Symbiobacteriaceae bacterium]|nr:zinc-binding alcohol dehydrogenase [Symbiobacteriaceae bacterium]
MLMQKRVELRGGGEIAVAEHPAPALEPGRVLIDTRYSLVSPGTELGLINRQVGNNAPFALGYSAAGVVRASAVPDFAPGDAVACYGGPYTHHGSVLSVPKHLVAKVPAGMTLREAAAGGLGTIATHSLRRCGLAFGETLVVVGMGVLGNLIAQLGLAAGYQVVATDPVGARRHAAAALDIDILSPDHEALKARVLAVTEGRGADAVAVCAGGEAAPFLDQAIDLVRAQGRVVIVGNVPGRFEREALFQKEADILIARAGGPGRYDQVYEQDGVDYPAGYVRWTEGRNLAEFLRQVAIGRVQVAPLITHEFALDEAPAAYQLMRGPEGAAAMGVLLRYSGH